MPVTIRDTDVGRILTRSLATTIRSRISIRGRPCKHLPHIWFDYHLVVITHTVCAQVPKFGRLTLEMWAWLTPQKDAPTPHVLSPNLVALGPTDFA